MPQTAPLTDAQSALEECEALVSRLHKMCCEPDRSPRMMTIEESLGMVRRDLATADRDSLDFSLARLEDIGSQIGSLQVGCCAPVRMPLYAEALEHLNRIQLDVTKTLGRSH